MSLQSAEQFTQAIANNPALLTEVTEAASSKSLDEAVAAIVVIGKREGFDFSLAEAAQTRGAHLQALSDSDLDKVAGGGNGYIESAAGTAASGVAGQMAPGVGGIIGAGVGAGVSTAVGGGSASEAVTNAALAANQNLNDSKSIVQQIFSGW